MRNDTIIQTVLHAARAIVDEVASPSPSDEELAAELKDILFGRKERWVVFVRGIITFDELNNVVASDLISYARKNFPPTNGVKKYMVTEEAMSRLENCLQDARARPTS